MKNSNYTPKEALLGVLMLIGFALFILFCLAISGAGFRQWTDRQTALHEAADTFRALGYSEDSELIRVCQSEWHKEEAHMQWVETEPEETVEAVENETVETAEPAPESEETPVQGQLPYQDVWEPAGLNWTEYCSFCYCGFKEAGPGCEPEHQRAQAAVIWNRKESDRFPNTVYEVLTQPGQYSGRYIVDSLDGIPQENIDAVNAVLSGEYRLPPDVVWQANFPQGTYTYQTFYVNSDGFKSTTYICGGYNW